MGRRRLSTTSPYGYDIEPWSGPLGPFYRIPTDKEIAVQRDYANRAVAMLERRFGPASDIAQMLGLATAPGLVVAA